MENIIQELKSSYNCCKYCFERIIDFQPNENTIKNTNNTCKLCNGIIEKAWGIKDKVIINLAKFEFSNFMVGVILPDIFKESDRVYKKYGLRYLTVKQAIAKIYSNYISKNLKKEINRNNAEIIVTIDLHKKVRYQLSIKPLFILGKYNKYSREIPQTKWPCGKCKGKKCSECNFTGQQYPKSVESLVAKAFMKEAITNNSSFHGAGREDIDALMLGDGRPFVLELKNPMNRTINLEKCVDEANKSELIKINSIQFCNKSIIKLIKSTSSESGKSYRARVSVSNPLTEQMIEILKSLDNKEIQLEQRTPERVSHRRADMIRIKNIYSTKLENIIDDKTFDITVDAQGGAYIKEYISGDNGRTHPSLSKLLLNEAKCKELDVIKVDDKGIF